jgi:hypothetical protein
VYDASNTKVIVAVAAPVALDMISLSDGCDTRLAPICLLTPITLPSTVVVWRMLFQDTVVQRCLELRH